LSGAELILAAWGASAWIIGHEARSELGFNPQTSFPPGWRFLFIENRQILLEVAGHYPEPSILNPAMVAIPEFFQTNL